MFIVYLELYLFLSRLSRLTYLRMKRYNPRLTKKLVFLLNLIKSLIVFYLIINVSIILK